MAKDGGVGNLGEIFFVIEGVQLKSGGLGILKTNTTASSSAGETDMTVPAAIVLGVAAAAAATAGAGAAGAAGAAAGGEADGGEAEDTRLRFKMYIYKEFGNAIRYDKPPVFVYARMAQIDAKGVETDRPDLTERITVFSENAHMRVGTPTPAGQYMGASVEAVHRRASRTLRRASSASALTARAAVSRTT